MSALTVDTQKTTFLQTDTTAVNSIVSSLKSVLASLPDETTEQLQGILGSLSLPTLESPSASASTNTLAGLSLDTLLTAIGNETRRQAVQSGVADIETKGKEQEAENNKILEEIKTQLDKMKSQSVANGFLKVFTVIGTFLGAVASVASLAVGIATCNPALIAAGTVGLLMTADGILSQATDGSFCLSAALTKLGKAMGLSDEHAQIFATAIYAAVSIAVIAVNIGATASAVSSSASTASKFVEIGTTVGKAGNIMGGVNTIGTGAATIASGVISSQVTSSQAKVKEFQAVLEKIQQAVEFDESIIKAEMERSQDLMDAVMDIVENCNQAQTSVLTANPQIA